MAALRFKNLPVSFGSGFILFIPFARFLHWLSLTNLSNCATQAGDDVMKRRTLFVLFAAACVAFFSCKGSAKQEEQKAFNQVAPPDTLVAAFYNVENLFDFHLDGSEYNEYRPGSQGWTEEMYRLKLDQTAMVIAALNADVVGLCEVENSRVVDELREVLEKQNCRYPYSVSAPVKGSAITVAMLSRYKIESSWFHEVNRTRPILEAVLYKGKDQIRFFVNHWPSKMHPESARMEAAHVLRSRLDSLPPGTDYVIMGDLNSNYDESASFTSAGFDDTRGKTGINQVLKTTLNESGRMPIRHVLQGDLMTCPDCHYNLWMDLPEDRRMSYVHRGSKQTLDNMLVPNALFDSCGFAYLDNSFEIITCEGKLLRDGVPFRWQMRFAGEKRFHTGEGFSDHLPVRARFVRKPYQSSGVRNEDADMTTNYGDFESGCDGWISTESAFGVYRDSSLSKKGRYSLHIRGIHQKSNKTAARLSLRETEGKAKLVFDARGKGKISIRVRRAAENPWVYFNAPDFSGTKSAKYQLWQRGDWKQLEIPLASLKGRTENLEVEIRAGKAEELSLWIDGVHLE